jgi:hypothetical protein
MDADYSRAALSINIERLIPFLRQQSNAAWLQMATHSERLPSDGPTLTKPFQMDGLKQLLQSALDSGMTRWQSHLPLSELSLVTTLQGVFRRRQLPQAPGYFCSASAAEAVSSGSPDFSLASILTRSSGSGLRSRACDHWKRASSTRPTRQ